MSIGLLVYNFMAGLRDGGGLMKVTAPKLIYSVCSVISVVNVYNCI